MFTLPMALFLSAGAVALFSFLAVAVWSDNRRREGEAYYKNEQLKIRPELQVDETVTVAVLREQERIARQRTREGIRLGGLITTAVGIGLMVFLHQILNDRAYLAGLIVVLTGVALLAYGYILAPKD
jgi:hypothetical protein